MPDSASFARAEFVPAHVSPPKEPLPRLKALLAARRNPLELWDEALYQRPSRAFRWMGRTFVQIADPAMMQDVLHTRFHSFRKSDLQQRFTSPALGGGILAVEGDNWRTQRRAAAPAFRPEQLNQLGAHMMEAGHWAVEQIRDVNASGPVDVLPILTRATFRVIAQRLLGEDASSLERDRFLAAMTAYVDSIGVVDWIDALGYLGWRARPYPKQGRDAVKEMQAVANRALHKRLERGEGGDDLMGCFLRARNPKTGQRLSVDAVRDQIINFLIAGDETTALTLTWALYLLANTPHIQEQVQHEVARATAQRPLCAQSVDALPLCQRVVKETLRLYPPIAMLQRTALEDAQIGDMTLKRGDEAICLIYVMHRNTCVWKNPNAFDPDRFTPERAEGRHRFAHLPFGGGPHICVGMRMALMEATLMLASLVQAFSFVPAPGPPVEPLSRITLRPKHGMPLWVHARAKCEAGL